MLAVRFEEVVSKGAGAAVALFSGAVIREMYRTKILSVKVRCLAAQVLQPRPSLCILLQHIPKSSIALVASLMLLSIKKTEFCSWHCMQF